MDTWQDVGGSICPIDFGHQLCKDVASGEYRRAELRSPDPATNPYLAFALVIYAALDGIKNDLELMSAADINLYGADISVLSGFETLPENHGAACELAKNSAFIAEHIPESIMNIYCGR